LLDLIGRHPFLTLDDISALTGWTFNWARWQRRRLVELGLARSVGAGEVTRHFDRKRLVELTHDGLWLLAAHQGLTLGAAVRTNGLVGGGPNRPVGPRFSLLKNLEHTIGVNRFFAYMSESARKLADAGGDDAFMEWRPAAACARGGVRPDGYGVYHRDGKLFGFFLEYDRGTEKGRVYRAKFAGYHDYRASRAFEREFEGFPTILVVTTGPGPEERIARAIGAVGVGRKPELPVLLTTVGRMEATEAGLSAPIWREPGTRARRPWPIRVTQGAVDSGVHRQEL
jgi:hypothetical protein